MSEVLVEKMQRVDFDVLICNLADNMRKYDELIEERSPAYNRMQSVSKTLEDIDLELPLEDQPYEVACNSLKLLISERKLTRLESALWTSDTSKFEANSLLYTGRLFGQKVVVESLDPEKHKLGTLRRNQYGNLDGLGRWHTVKRGKVVDLYLDSMSGGALQVQGRFGLIYQASPLIDRGNNYSPAFSIQKI